MCYVRILISNHTMIPHKIITIYWWTHCLTRESQYHWIYANSPNANFTVGIIRPRVLRHLFCFHFKIAFIVMCFLLFLIRNNCGCSIRVCELYLNKIEKINVFPAASCPNIWEHVIISNCRDTFIAFSIWCAFPALFLIGFFAKTEIIFIEVVSWQYIYIYIYIRDFEKAIIGFATIEMMA